MTRQSGEILRQSQCAFIHIKPRLGCCIIVLSHPVRLLGNSTPDALEGRRERSGVAIRFMQVGVFVINQVILQHGSGMRHKTLDKACEGKRVWRTAPEPGLRTCGWLLHCFLAPVLIRSQLQGNAATRQHR